MAIVVLGPYSGLPVKVRDQDVGRAVKDEQGRVFYVLPKSDGSGHYGAITRVGGAKDEARALEMEQKTGAARTTTQQNVLHDATGPGRKSSMRGKLVILILAAIVAALVWYFGIGPGRGTWTKPPVPPAPVQGLAPAESAPTAGSRVDGHQAVWQAEGVLLVLSHDTTTTC